MPAGRRPAPGRGEGGLGGSASRTPRRALRRRGRAIRLSARRCGYPAGIVSATAIPGPAAGPLIQSTLFHRDPLGFLLRARARYGDVFALSLPTARRVVVIADPAAVGEVLTLDRAVTAPGSGRRRVLGMASPASVLGADRELHRAARGRIAPAFAPAALARHGGAIERLAAEHAARWPRGRPFRLLERMRALSDEVFVRFVLGVPDDERVAALVAAIRRMLWTPGNPPLPLTTGDRGLLGVAGERVWRRRRAPVDRLLVEALAARRAAGDPAGDGVLGLLVAGAPPLSDAEIIDALVPLLMAGQEPGAVGLTWLLDRLARHPEAAGRFAPGDDPASDAFARESLRLRPAVHSVLRPLTAPLRVAGLDLAAGTVAMVPILLVHRDPRVFADPHAFRPERFLDEEPPPAFIPFGGGVRRCLGEALATLSERTIVPAILRTVRLRAVSRRPERPVVRATVLPPHRSGLVVATGR